VLSYLDLYGSSCVCPLLLSAAYKLCSGERLHCRVSCWGRAEYSWVELDLESLPQPESEVSIPLRRSMCLLTQNLFRYRKNLKKLVRYFHPNRHEYCQRYFTHSISCIPPGSPRVSRPSPTPYAFLTSKSSALLSRWRDHQACIFGVSGKHSLSPQLC
jgi:hypothetical protein